jgi:ketosteroid isomerase-like protein
VFNRSLISLVTLVVLLIPAFGQDTHTPNKKDQAIEKEIRRLNAEERDALMKNDVKALGSIWSDDFVVTNPFNQFVTKQQVLKLVENGTLAFKSYERNVEYVKVYGNGTVIVAGSETCVWGGKIPIAGQESHLRITSIWMKQGGRWQEVARHANIMPPSQQKPKL